MDQLIYFQSQVDIQEINKKTVFEVNCEQIRFLGGHSYNVVGFKDISTKEMLRI